MLCHLLLCPALVLWAGWPSETYWSAGNTPSLAPLNNLFHAYAVLSAAVFCRGPLGWLVPSEIQPLETRAAGGSGTWQCAELCCSCGLHANAQFAQLQRRGAACRDWYICCELRVGLHLNMLYAIS
jgi:hypothetical protein